MAKFLALATVAVVLSQSISTPAPAAQDSPEAALGYQRTDPPRALGEIEFNDGEGRPVSLADLRGKVVLMNFWATWCPPCVREMPSLRRLQAKFDKADFEVVLISEDRNPAVIAPFYDRYELNNMAIYHDPGSRLSRKLAVAGLPTTILIDAAGNEVGRVLGAAEWDGDVAVDLIRGYLEQASGVRSQPLEAAALE